MASSTTQWLTNQRDVLISRFVNNLQTAVQNIQQLIPYNQRICILSDLYPLQHPSWYKLQPLGPVGAIGVPYLAQIGSDYFVLKKSKIEEVRADLDFQVPSGVNIEPFVCNFFNPNLIYLGSDEYTNELLIGVLLNWILKKQGYVAQDYRPIIGYLGFFICNGFGYILTEYCNLGSLDSFPSRATPYKEVINYLQDHNLVAIEIVSPQWSLEILKQVTVGFKLLQEIAHFISGDAKVANIFLTDRPLKFNYKGLSIDSPFTCKIADYGKSSMTLNLGQKGLYRIYNKAKTPIIDILSPYRQLREFTFSGNDYYILPSLLDVDVLVMIRHLGVPAYQSIDIYTFMISWLMMPEFYYSIMIKSELRSRLWDLLWYPDDLETINKRLYREMIRRSKPSFKNVIPLLKDLKLKCQALDLLFDSLKNF